MSDPYATPATELRDPAQDLSVRSRTSLVFAVLNLGLGTYLAYALLPAVLASGAAAARGAFTWDLVLYGALLILPVILLVKGAVELLSPGALATLWRQSRSSVA